MARVGSMSLAQFAAHLESKQLTWRDGASREGLELAARVVKAEAKKEIGHYQDQAGEFISWPDLADSTKEDREKKGFSEDEPLLRSGELRRSIEMTVSARDQVAVVGSDSDEAVWQELGTARIPPRSFLGGAAFRKREFIRAALGEAAVSHLVGKGVFGGRLPIPDDE